MKARTASRLTRISPLNKASRLKALSALLQASIAAGAFSAAVPAVAGTKHVSDYFPGILWSNPLGWGPVGEPRGGDVIFVDKGPGIAFAPLLGIDETFEALTVNASTDTNPLLFVPLTSTVIPIPAVNDFPANVLLPAMHLRSNNVTLGETQAGALIQTGGSSPSTRISVSATRTPAGVSTASPARTSLPAPMSSAMPSSARPVSERSR
ncbi:MAG: hypothetical protein IPK20_13380 [Betaproteobacteria bacterium]|nr:hypothetical protein [Betaproteobacteria bacterium]